MTTIPTPYDAEENAFQEWLSEHGDESAPRTPLSEWLRAWRLGGAEGYRRAKAEDAVLLKAAKAVDEAGQDCLACAWPTIYEHTKKCEQQEAREAAIAAVEGRKA